MICRQNANPLQSEISSLEKESRFPEVHEGDFEKVTKNTFKPIDVCVCVCEIFTKCYVPVFLASDVLISCLLRPYGVPTAPIPMTGKETEVQNPKQAVWSWSVHVLPHCARPPPPRSVDH